MTGVYERALAAAADDLHPQVRERYSLSPDDEVATVGSGLMDITRGALALPVLAVMPARNLLFPESGTDVPFTVTTAGYRTAAGHEALTTVREFDFGDRCRRFDSLTVWDDANGRLLDFLGTGGHVVSELQPRVEDGALVVAGGRQWVRLAGRYVRLPWPLAVDVTVRDRYEQVLDGPATYPGDPLDDFEPRRAERTDGRTVADGGARIADNSDSEPGPGLLDRLRRLYDRLR